jgi:hypothetical protein
MSIFHSGRLEDRNIGKKKVSELTHFRNKTIIIHYSCESFFNTHGRTPRVTSIAVKNRDNGTTKTFSIHLSAQVKKKDLTNLSDPDFDYLEKQMLKDFYDYVKKHSTYRWVHWNMRNSSFGFEAIANRFKILGGVPKEIEDQFKYDLPEVMGLIYTYEFEKHDAPTTGQLLNLSLRNKISTRDALTGALEASAFAERNFLKLHMSSMRKVEMIDRILTLEEKGALLVNVSIIKACGLSPSGIIEIVRNNWFLFAIWSVSMAVLGSAVEPVIQRFFQTS